jgi:thioredoxin reductase/Pyruvate/2-oxoacid:ferredoxin oxidoreductase delta subunit
MSFPPDPSLLFFILPLFLIFWTYMKSIRRAEAKSRGIRDAAIDAGLTEPASLHPLIDKSKCLGCTSCIGACPEHHVIGLINGQAELIDPTHCIGHGVCEAACPHGALTLVFGTEKRGLDIPHVNPNFETNVPGVFIAGELGGMGLIRNAIEQGKQAIGNIRKLDGIGKGDRLDVVIVGAGPSGFSASLAAMEGKMRFVTVEQDTFGGTVAHYPRGKLVMTAPGILPIVGKTPYKEVQKEELIRFWEEAREKVGLKINTSERVEAVTPLADGFEVKTTRNVYQTRAVLLTIGRRGTPRQLGVPGENHTKVVYRLIDPEQYRGKHVVVVGGGDSALEAAASIAEEPGTSVILSYRSEAFGRAKQKNRERVDAAEQSGILKVMLKSGVKRVGDDDIEIEHKGERHTFKNDAVIVCAGGILPTDFLKKIGIEVETKYGTK